MLKRGQARVLTNVIATLDSRNSLCMSVDAALSCQSDRSGGESEEESLERPEQTHACAPTRISGKISHFT
jgi:hypothetical protein